jgi:hypothetical protein
VLVIGVGPIGRVNLGLYLVGKKNTKFADILVGTKWDLRLRRGTLWSAFIKRNAIEPPVFVLTPDVTDQKATILFGGMFAMYGHNYKAYNRSRWINTVQYFI